LDLGLAIAAAVLGVGAITSVLLLQFFVQKHLE
jgi:hypothetical protein